MKNYAHKRIIVIIMLFLLAFGLRAWGISDAAYYTGEEAGQIPAAKSFVATGHTDSTYWHHPPLGMIILDGAIKLLGDNPYGWRTRNLLLGSLTIIMVFLTARQLFSETRIAFIAGLLLALDPLHILLSRTTFDEIPAGFFFLSAVYVIIKYLKGNITTPVLAGIFLGLSLASKLYYLLGLPALLIFVVWCKNRDEGFNWNRTAHIFLVFTALPLTVYVLSYLPWFRRGYDLYEFFQFQVDAMRDIKNMTLQWFENNYILRESGMPWEWFIRPRMFGLQFGEGGDRNTFLIFMNNAPVWLLTWPAFLFLAYRGFKERGRFQLLAGILLISSYLPPLLMARPIFMYSAVTVLPFAFMAIAYLTVFMLEKFKANRWVYPSLLVLLLVWSMYLYPLATRREMPMFLYEPLLSNAKIFRVF